MKVFATGHLARLGRTMRSQLRFIMHTDDEAALVTELLRDPAILFVDGPRWKTVTPPTTRDISAIGSYCMIWSPEDLPRLSAEFIQAQNDWYCRDENSTIQFLRCKMTETVIVEGSFAISTGPAEANAAANVERRYKFLCRAIKRTYRNSVVQWRNPRRPDAPAGPSRSANPSAPDRSRWVGPAAMTWMAGHADRRVKTFLTGFVEGAIIEPG
ncbi:hypothetical protein [Mesorhizobium sp.]|uniref:hypothetical protein n=1 Tax=Mesorhizobium sp. TaxID=1871066 RepID=UPI000FE8884C|nr:hypothetical protein [Mesorhizobium sp.]RWM74577.1 MAG: hypothetical protein EOR82_04955 [Mesorhizobium sp.]TIO27909.1 MAG: hypothetical protein E5X83_00380 [Mesorhizobium sp.]TJV63381.1 MAG: hypothetical protein E5X82_05825 [Mesorhizobium sp.]